MRGGHAQPSRAMAVTPALLSSVVPYDAAGVAPHAYTVRGTYTVPTGRRAAVAPATLTIYRATAAGVVGVVEQILQFTPSGGSTYTLARLSLYDNTVGAYRNALLPSIGDFLAGDALQIQSYDASTTGTCNHLAVFRYVESTA